MTALRIVCSLTVGTDALCLVLPAASNGTVHFQARHIDQILGFQDITGRV